MSEPRRDKTAAASGAAAAGAGGAGGAGGARAERAPVRKTYKLFVGGGFPRSESGRSYVVRDAAGGFLAHAALASRKDVRDAVVAARQAFGPWSGTTAYNRGQVLYRVAEMLEDRRSELASAVAHAEGLRPDEAETSVAAAVDRLVWYAGWPDKLGQVAGAANPVAGPYFNFSLPEPTGVVGVLAPQRSSLLGLVSVVAPVIATGNTAVVVASQDRPLPAVGLAEVLAHSDVPGGVVNVLTGRLSELAPVLAAHRDVDALDLCGAGTATPAGAAEGVLDGAAAADGEGSGTSGTSPELAVELERAAATNVKRVLRAEGSGEPEWTDPPGTKRLLAFVEIKTVWHPLGV